MKKLFFTLLLTFLVGGTLFAQSPIAFPYQAVARDNAGVIMANQNITIWFSILDSSSNGLVLYKELHAVTTNGYGLFTVQIGTGTPQGTGPMSSVDWSNGLKWLHTEINPLGGTVPQALGTTQLLSVPYALYASNAPFYNSGWFPMNSQAGTASFKELTHGLGAYPSKVQVQVRAINGNNTGFIFEGMGASQNDDDVSASNYGGLIYGYDKTRVRLWVPSVNNGSNTSGHIINVTDGWGGEVNKQASDSAQVRVIVWR